MSGGGQLNDSGSHLVDVMLWTTGLAAESVFAHSETYGGEVDIDSAVSVRFTGGALGTLSIVGHSPIWREELSVWGSEGTLVYRNGQVLECGPGPWEYEMDEVSGLSSSAGEDPYILKNPGPDRNFVDAILGRDEVRVPPGCGLRVLELVEAAWRSIDLGRPVLVAELQ